MKDLIISFSGGKTSGAMTKKLLDKYRGLRRIIVVFMNTGKEREETLRFVRNCDIYFGFETVWIEAIANHGERKTPDFRIVDFMTASRSGEPFEDMIKKHGIPNVSFPHCTRELKTAPFNNYIKSLGITDYEVAIGIRIDEPKRLKPKPNIVYPLVKEFPMDKAAVNKWWEKQDFTLELKGYEGNCNMCWKKSKRKLLTLVKEHPEFAEWWKSMEEVYGNYIPATQAKGRTAPITFFREGESMDDLIEESKFKFEPATDDKILNQLMNFQLHLDFTNGCEESCEVF